MTECFVDHQLREYSNDGAPGPSIATPPEQPDCSNNTAAGILGLKRPHRLHGYTTLDREVQRYYDDIEYGEDILAYWQVSPYLLL